MRCPKHGRPARRWCPVLIEGDLALLSVEKRPGDIKQNVYRGELRGLRAAGVV